MDTKKYIFDRHMQKWEDDNKLLKRTCIGALFFCLILLFRILVPYSEVDVKKGRIQNNIVRIVEKKKHVEEEKSIIQEFTTALNKIRGFVRNPPWQKEKRRLINYFQQRRSRAGLTPTSPQQEADKTIRNIVEDIDEQIISPLEKILSRVSEDNELLGGISQKVNQLTGAVKEWEKQHIGKRWYGTIPEKNIAMEQLTEKLKRKIRPLTDHLNALKPKTDAKHRELTKRSHEVEKELDDARAELEPLEQEFQKILPEWLQGILSLPDMMQLLPLLILVLCLFVSLKAVMLTNHYEHIAAGIGLSAEERQDLAASSIWTLTYRGRLGTTLTSLVYVLFILVMWFCFEWGFDILNRWGAVNPDKFWVDNILPAAAIRWLGRIIFIVMIAFFFKEPLRRKNKI